jgi:hypothetical protein
MIPTKVEAATLKISKAKATMEIDSTLKLKLGTVEASSISWKSSNVKIVSVTKTGTIRAKKEGSVTITANYKSKKYTCDVTVVDSNKDVTEKDYYSLGETWAVEGQWKLTFDSVTTTDYRNSYFKNQNQVIILKYTYENLGYDGALQGLYISSMNIKIVDENSEVASSYPMITNKSPEITPIGAKCVGVEEAYGLSNKSNEITVYVDMYDKNYNQIKAKFILKVD